MAETPIALKHDTDENRRIARENAILVTQVGSGLHGISVEGTDDRDEMGICIEPPEYVIGLRRFEQYESRTQPMHVRSGPGDLDFVCYSLRKWSRLASQGNPSVLLPLFAPDSEVCEIQWPGRELRARRGMFISQYAGRRFAGYLDQQHKRMLGLLSKRTNRPELVEKYGFDTKFAGHAVRLGLQGVELLTTGELTLPMQPAHRERIVAIRTGLVPKDEVTAQVVDLRERINTLCETSWLPERPDITRINDWLTTVHISWWAGDR
jgi:hypothetical protein